MRFQSALAALPLLVGLAAAPTHARSAMVYPWCARYPMEDASANCVFMTFEQCKATILIVGGSCSRAVEAAPQEQPPPSRRRRG